MGDALSEQAATDAILASNFDAEKALDRLLNASTVRPPSKKEEIKKKPINLPTPGNL